MQVNADHKPDLAPSFQTITQFHTQLLFRCYNEHQQIVGNQLLYHLNHHFHLYEKQAKHSVK